MANPTPPSKTVKRRRWARTLLIIAGALFVLLFVFYFVATSAAFFKGVILPRVSKAVGAEVTVGDASLSPFSRVVLRQLKVRTTGAEPLLQANEVRLRYSLWSIIGGHIKVDEVTLDTPTILIVQNADGTSNLDPLLKKEAKPAEKPAAQPSKPLQLEVKNVALKNVSLRAVQNLKDGGQQAIDLSDINISLDQLKNGAAGKLTLAAAMKMDRTQTNAHDSLQARGSGALEFALGPDLIPQFVRGKVTHEIVKGDGSFSSVAGERTELNCDITPTEVKTFSVNFFQANKALGALRVTGPFDLNKQEGRLKLEIQSIDRQVLNLAGAARGWDFGSSTLNATNLIDISQKASVIAASGKLSGRQLGIRQGNQSTPSLDLDFDYQVTVNLKDQTALLQRLDLAGKQGPNELLHASLDKPMNLSWGQSQPGFKESSLQLAVNKLNLADWQLFLGSLPVSGKVDAQLDLLAQQGGKQLKADLTTKVQELNAQFGSNKVDRANVQLQVAGQLTDFKKATVEKYSFTFGQANQSLLTATGSASYVSDSGDLSAQATVEGSLPGLLKLAGVPQLNASAGAIKLTALALRKGQETGASGNLALSDFSGRYGDYQFQNYQTTVAYDIGVKDNIAQVRRLALAVRQGSEPGGSFEAAGKCDLAKQSGEVTFTAADFNQNAFRPFLAAALAPNKLISISLNGKGSAGFAAQGETSIKAELKIANLVVEDPEKKLPKSPLAAGLQLDGSMRQQLLSLRQFLITLSPTDRAKNQLQLSGKIDLAKANAAPGQLLLQAESLDLTPYYDLFARQPTTAAAIKEPEKKTPPIQQTPATRAEPDPIALPFQKFAFDAKIDRLYLRELAVSNFVTSAKTDNTRLLLKPFQLTLNGAPVSADADLNLGVKGWTYNLSLNADKIPLDPIVNSFMPDSRGRYHGLILANAQIKGAGITDASLQKNLAGQFGLSFTNASIQLFADNKPPKNVFTRLLWYTLEGIGVFLRINEIASSPLNAIYAQAQIADGKVNLSRVAFQSQAFEAHTQGVVPLQVPLTNSPLNLPLEFSLSRSLAQKSGLMPAKTPPDAAYAALPTFVTVKGTVGDPKRDFNELALGGLLLKGGVGIAEKAGVNVGGKTGSLIKGVGNLLTGQGTGNATTNTNDVSTNPPPAKFNPLDLFPKKKK